MSRSKAKRYPQRRNSTTITDSTRAKTLADLSWGKTVGPTITVMERDGTERKLTARQHRTWKAREGLREKWLREAHGDPKAARNLERAYYRELGQKGARARWRKKEETV